MANNTIELYAYSYAYKIIKKVPGYTLSKAQRIFRGHFNLVQKYVTAFNEYEEAKRAANLSFTVYFNVINTLRELIKELTRHFEEDYFGKTRYELENKTEIVYKDTTVIYELAKSGFITTSNKDVWIAATSRVIDDVSKQLSDRIDELAFEKQITIKEA